MAIEAKKPEISKETYVTAGTGALLGGAASKAAINSHLSSAAKKTVKAFDGSASEYDTFVKKHADLITKAVESKKGVFGKINKLITKSGGIYTDEIIDNTTGEVMDGYWKKAAGKLSHKFSGSELETKTEALRNKLLSKEIYKSYKSATKFKNAAIVAGAAMFGLFGACILKELKDDSKPKEKTPAVSVH
ncbi:MAG: hypothetical protein LUE64_00165 [Candidatus Gastranaerophilales bacterium]|nr:hypothetical protein [Candidatus Gastranaerophilales bacterium]